MAVKAGIEGRREEVGRQRAEKKERGRKREPLMDKEST